MPGPYIIARGRQCFEVFGMLKEQSLQRAAGVRAYTWRGITLCREGFKKLVAVGSGRFRTLDKAAQAGLSHPPMDMRFIKRGAETSDKVSGKRQLVHNFLMSLYMQCAEPIPDGLNSNKRPRHGSQKLDPKNLDRSQMRHLPPGSFAGYHRQFMALHPDSNVSRKLFCTEWQSGFMNKLRIRFEKHHARCSQCVKHRLILKRLGHQPHAARAQRAELLKHLRRQHADRRVYWDLRARSRLDPCREMIPRGLNVVYDLACILDSMDQGKHAWPRSSALMSKDFGSFNRPSLISTTLLMHGWGVLTALSDHTVTSCNSRTVEVLSAGLTALSADLDLRSCALHIQGDNCSKELKNNCVVRTLAIWVALRKVSSATAGFLTSGHSHEDIDQLFSNMGAWINGRKELHTPAAFRECVQAFLDDPSSRPHEKHFRRCVIMNRFHDWPGPEGS